MSFTSEFREFAVKGNVVDLAVGVIIGAAFGKIVESFVSDLVMPVIGKFTGGLGALRGGEAGNERHRRGHTTDCPDAARDHDPVATGGIGD